MAKLRKNRGLRRDIMDQTEFQDYVSLFSLRLRPVQRDQIDRREIPAETSTFSFTLILLRFFNANSLL